MKEPQLILGDCRDILKTFPDKSIDLLLTDPVWPNSLASLEGAERPWELFEEAAAEFPRIAKTVVIHLGCTSDPRFLSGLSRTMPFLRTCWLRYSFPSKRGRFLIGSDVAYAFGEPPKSRKGNHLLKGELNPGYQEQMINKITNRGHPTPRKIEHVKELVHMFSNEGDTVLDPFMGSGTTAVAAKFCNRNFIGIEIVPDYIKLAEDRLSAMSESLFTPIS